MSSLEAAPLRSAVPTDRGPRLRVLDALCVAAAAAPFVVVAVVVLVRGHLVLGGDQGLIALDALDARHLGQAVGPYSRFGWAHPGPAWTYLLAPAWWAFGSTGQALIAASLLVHAAFAAAVVLAVRAQSSWERPLMTGIVMLYVLRMPAIYFVNIWNPFALLLPTMLLLLMAARACTGRVAACSATVLVGSYLVQTHIGTAPLVGLVGLTVAAAFALQLRRRRVARPARREWLGAGAALAVTVLIWLPPVLQQLFPPTPGRGNLALLADYFVHGGGQDVQTHTWREAFSTVGQVLGAPVYHWTPAAGPVDTSFLSLAVVGVVLAVAVGGLVVGLTGHRRGEPTPAWIGLLTSVACLAGLVAARSVTGEMQSYLLLWLSVLPPMLLFAGVSVLACDSRARSRRFAVIVVVAVAALALMTATAAGASLHRSADSELPDEPGAAQAAQLALDALPEAEPGDPPILLDIRDVSVWITATAVAVDLSLKGYRISVEPQWVYSFGEDRRSNGDEQWRLSLVPGAREDAPVTGQLGVVDARVGPTAVALVPTHRQRS